MVLDPEPPTAATRNPSLDVPPPGGLSVPSFHYPQRQKRKTQTQQQQPLGVVPDFNRVGGGGGQHFKSGSFCFGPRAGGVPVGMRGRWEEEGEEGGKENAGFAVY